MTKYFFHGIDCANLFDLSIEPISFKDNPKDHIPKYGLLGAKTL
jgi:hypothetical protein